MGIIYRIRRICILLGCKIIKAPQSANLNSHLRYFKGFNNCYIVLPLVMTSDRGKNKGKLKKH